MELTPQDLLNPMNFVSSYPVGGSAQSDVFSVEIEFFVPAPLEVLCAFCRPAYLPGPLCFLLGARCIVFVGGFPSGGCGLVHASGQGVRWRGISTTVFLGEMRITPHGGRHEIQSPPLRWACSGPPSEGVIDLIL